MYISSGQGRKSGGARATGATPSLAPVTLPFRLVTSFDLINVSLAFSDVNQILLCSNTKITYNI